MSVTAREAALKALGAFRRNGAWPEAFLDNLILKEGMDGRDAALASRLCYGVLQNKQLCDYYISHFSSVKPNKIEPLIYDILELSVYQLLFTDRIPNSAAVSEGVNLAKKYANPRAAGYVNAVLRKISENPDTLPEISGNTIEEKLSIKYSHPLALINLLKGFMELGEVEKFLVANNGIVPITAQVNTLKTTTENVLAALASENTEVSEHLWLKDCILLEGGGSLTRSKVFTDGLITIQDVSSRLAVMAASPKKGQAVLDACSAPGGKSFMAAIIMSDSGSILSADIHENKLSRIREGADRLGIKIISTAKMDAAMPDTELFGKFDLVIADVPCSNLGIIRKKPEIRYKNIEELKRLPEVQSAILDNVSRYVKPGGVLMYSTCTIVPEENAGVVNAFLGRHGEFEAEAFTLPDPIGKVESGMLTLYPHIHGTDGFFMCRMRKS